MTTTGICGVFHAEVVERDEEHGWSLTGELVFVSSAMLVDYGGNRLAGPFRSVPRALARQRRFRIPTKFVPAPKAKYYRRPGEHPDGCADFPSIHLGSVEEKEIT